MIAVHEDSMPRRKSSDDQKLLFFPDYDKASVMTPTRAALANALPSTIYAPEPIRSDADAPARESACEIVISGTFRKDVESLRNIYEEFLDLGCTVLSPSSISIVSEHDGFVFMKGEERDTPEAIEARHLSAIQNAQFVWLHTPEGYVGPTAALELGFAHAAGVPIYTKELPKDQALKSFVQVVSSPQDLLKTLPRYSEPRVPALKAFQEYYRRVALERGYASEGPKDCLLLMVEEVGELARALRKREKLMRHGPSHDVDEANELADVFLYVVHMANVLGLDLGRIVRDKELLNLEKLGAH